MHVSARKDKVCVKERESGNTGVLGDAGTRVQSVPFDWSRWSRAPVAKQEAPTLSPAAFEPVPAPTYRAFDVSAGWTRADELACTARCKRCKRPIVWGEVTERLGRCNDRRRWIPLDPDLSFHACERTRGDGQRNERTK